jgi:hypothetical protein
MKFVLAVLVLSSSILSLATASHTKLLAVTHVIDGDIFDVQF